MTARRGRVSIGIAGVLGADAAAALAPAVQAAGFHGLWVNDTPGADSLEVLAAAAGVTDTLMLATGVVPVDRRSAQEIVDAVHRFGLPEERLVLGIGSGGARRGALALVGDSVRVLRASTTARVLVGALGPRMRHLAAESADGALLSWLSPDVAATQAAELRDTADDAYVALYARTAVDAAAVARRDEEARRYAGYPAYAAHFARLDLDPLATVLPLPGDEGIDAGALAYLESVDELVLRAITPTDDLDDYLEFVARAADRLRAHGVLGTVR